MGLVGRLPRSRSLGGAPGGRDALRDALEDGALGPERAPGNADLCDAHLMRIFQHSMDYMDQVDNLQS